MKIDYLKIENFKSIERLQIDFNSADAVISGQNGTGKTSILDAVCWLLSNKMSDGKSGESSNFKNPQAVTVVEMKLDSGLTLRRECNGKSVYFVHGVPYNATDFKTCTAQIFKNAIPALLTPFDFCRFHYSSRRNILLNLFAGNVEVDMTDFSDIASDLQTLTPEQIILQNRKLSKDIDKELTAIPARINELSQNLQTELPQISSIETALLQNRNRYQQLQNAAKSEQAAQKEILALQSDALKLEKSLNEMRAQFVTNELELQRLRAEFSNIKAAMSGTCPTCGNKVPAANIDKLNSQLKEIVAAGKEISEKQELLKEGAAVAKEKAAELHTQAAVAQNEFKPSNVAAELETIISERDELQKQLVICKQAAESQKRIEQLKAREVELGVSKTLCDKKIYLAETYIRRKIELTEKVINDNFEYVKFKMYEAYKVAEGVKECCEPLLNDVPYYALSKGEQLKASLDILKTLQGAFGVELPVFIDDAESYTSNSFVELPNQVILLKAAEGIKKLKIDIDAGKTVERKTA